MSDRFERNITGENWNDSFLKFRFEREHQISPKLKFCSQIPIELKLLIGELIVHSEKIGKSLRLPKDDQSWSNSQSASVTEVL